MPKIISRAEAREQGLKRYFTGEPCKHGHLEERNTKSGACNSCVIEGNRKYKLTDKGKAKGKEWRNSEEGKKKKNESYLRLSSDPITKNRMEEKGKEWRNSEEGKKKKNEWMKKSLKDPIKHLEFTMRSRVNKIMTGKQRVKTKHTFELIGCTSEELKAHIEKQFKKTMSWKNYGEWHVDHIVPLAYFEKNFDMNLISIQRIAFNYNNLQPLWAEENLKKKDKTFLKEAEKKIAEIKKLINA